MDASALSILILLLITLASAVREREARALLRRCEQSGARLRQLLTEFRHECEQRVSAARRETAEFLLQGFEADDHARARQNHQRVGQAVLRSAGASLDQPASPRLEAETDIRQLYRLLNETQDRIRLASDPRARERWREAAGEYRQELHDRLQEYERLCEAEGRPMSVDIGEIMMILGE